MTTVLTIASVSASGFAQAFAVIFMWRLFSAVMLDGGGYKVEEQLNAGASIYRAWWSALYPLCRPRAFETVNDVVRAFPFAGGMSFVWSLATQAPAQASLGTLPGTWSAALLFLWGSVYHFALMMSDNTRASTTGALSFIRFGSDDVTGMDKHFVRCVNDPEMRSRYPLLALQEQAALFAFLSKPSNEIAHAFSAGAHDKGDTITTESIAAFQKKAAELHGALARDRAAKGMP